jgi:hypothetical protein
LKTELPNSLTQEQILQRCCELMCQWCRGRAEVPTQPQPMRNHPYTYCHGDELIATSKICAASSIRGHFRESLAEQFRENLALCPHGTAEVLCHLCEPANFTHVAWVRYVRHDGQPTTVQLCDSDSPGAFKVYRQHERVTGSGGVATAQFRRQAQNIGSKESR